MKRLICTMAVLLALCVPALAAGSLSMDEAMGIILDHHGVVTDMDVADYLTLDADTETMTREAAVTAVVRSFGVYPADEHDYGWSDEDEQEEQKQCGETIDAGVYLVVEAPEIEIDLQDDGKADGVVNDAQQEGVGGGSGVGGVEKVRNLEQSYRKI